MIVEKRKHKRKKGERRKLLAPHVILKEEGKKVIFKFERVILSHTSHIGWNKN
jgi:hypothetical protein